MPENYYVYLLRDPREPDYHRSIFYVGKGTGTRALMHRQDVLSSLDIEDDSTGIDSETLRQKEDRLRAIQDEGLTEKIDVLLGPSATPIAEPLALMIESALIEVLGHGERSGLTNRVRGHKLRLMPATAMTVGSTAREVELPNNVAAVVVPVNGLWGGRDYAGTVIEATDAEVWENSRRTWSRFGLDKQRTISARSKTSNPVLLLALAKDPGGMKPNIIVGVYPLRSVHESSAPKDRKGGYFKNYKDGRRHWVDEYNGWVLDRDDRQLQISEDLLRNVLTVDGIPMRRPQDRGYIGSW